MKKGLNSFGVRAFTLILAIAVVMAMVLVLPARSYAAPRVTKVTMVKKSGAKEYAILKGKTKSGKTVWTYKTRKYKPHQVFDVTHQEDSKQVYVYANGYMTRLSKQTGRVLFNAKKNREAAGCFRFRVYKGYIYGASWLSEYTMKISKKGKVVWKKKTNPNSKYGAVTKVTYKKGRIYVKYAQEWNREEVHTVVLTTGGKFVKK